MTGMWHVWLTVPCAASVLQEIAEKYPPWLEQQAAAGASSSLSAADLDRYRQQYACITRLCDAYEAEPTNTAKIMGLLQEVRHLVEHVCHWLAGWGVESIGAAADSTRCVLVAACTRTSQPRGRVDPQTDKHLRAACNEMPLLAVCCCGVVCRWVSGVCRCRRVVSRPRTLWQT